MVKNYFVFILLVFILISGPSKAQQNEVWEKANIDVNEILIQNDFEKKKDFQTFQLDLGRLKKQLSLLSQDKEDLKQAPIKVVFPLKNGDLLSFWLSETAVMHPELAKKYPNIRSYSGRGVDNPSMRINLTVNELGLHGMIISPDGLVEYIDPVKLRNNGSTNFYQVYKRSDITTEKQLFGCIVEQEGVAMSKSAISQKTYDKKLRTYRLALAATGEYSQYHIEAENAQLKSEAAQKAIVLLSMVTAVARINYLFEKDLAVRLQLVEDNDDLIFLTPGNPYTQENIGNMLTQNQNICNNIIGFEGYDIGHVVGTMTDGKAERASVCNNSMKAKGASGAEHPTGDSFYFNMMAHELGHQFGAHHTFNGFSENCGGNRHAGYTVEPGSGSTIMAYAGLCDPQNVQPNSDLYFHSVSIAEIWNHISGAGESCAEITELVNNINTPMAFAGSDFTIPKGTAFKLIGEGTDQDGDLLTYCWEQIDYQIGSVPPRENDKIGTMYRSYSPDLSNIRYLPALKELRNGALSTTWEVTPAVARDLNFSLTVRDNNPEAGQTAVDQLKVTVTDAAGPFVITSQNISGLVWEQNSDQLVEWDVAGTDANGVDVSKVNILLSTDGGLTFPTALLVDTDNDGMETIRVPFFTAGSCYIMVEAVDNLFFALNQRVFSIGENNNFCENRSSADTPHLIPDNDLSGIVSTIDIEEDINIEDISINIEIEHTSVKDLSIEVESPQGTKVILIQEACDFYDDDIEAIFSDAGEDIICSNTYPVIRGEIIPAELLSSFAGENAKGQWKLKVIDAYADDMGHLLSWGMNICSYEEVLAAKEHVLKGFVLYPNPADAYFELSFVLKSEKVDIAIYDALGRKVVQKSFQSSTLKFKERITTDHLRSGIYFLKINNGGFFAMEKVLIQ